MNLRVISRLNRPSSLRDSKLPPIHDGKKSATQAYKEFFDKVVNQSEDPWSDGTILYDNDYNEIGIRLTSTVDDEKLFTEAKSLAKKYGIKVSYLDGGVHVYDPAYSKVEDSTQPKSLLSRVCDMAKEDQTDQVKEELYKLTQQFVYKYWRKYYPAYKGDVEDLVSDMYLEFLTPKSRIKGKEESLLDKFDPSITTLPYVVKVAVQRMLIDKSRKDKGEKNYAEDYDEETGRLTLDFLANRIDDPEIQVDDIEFTPEEIMELRDLYDELPAYKKNHFIKLFRKAQEEHELAPNFLALFKDLTGERNWNDVTVEVSGKAPDYVAKFFDDGELYETRDYRAAHTESVRQKILKQYPSIREITFV